MVVGLISLGTALSETREGETAADGDVLGGTPGAFFAETVVEGLNRPTDFAFAPDGRIFIAEKNGRVRIFKDGEPLPVSFLEVFANTIEERGLIGLALDPDFETNGFVYIFYTVRIFESNPEGPKTGRVIRVTADGDVAAPGSAVVLLGSVVGDLQSPSCGDFPPGTDCIPQDAWFHVGGGMRFGSDGKLYIATGDGGQVPFDTPLRAQDLDSLAGKMLRINPDGSAPPDNPFFTGDPEANRSKVWAYGLRNPFRFGLQPGTNTPFIGDVGTDVWEEINVGAGENFGWPCYEGPEQVPDYTTSVVCQDLEAAGTAVFPLFAYPNTNGAAVIGGLFAQGASYPPEFQDAYFFADCIQGSIHALKVDESNNLVAGGGTAMTGAGCTVDFEIGPQGDIYFLSHFGGEVKRLRFAPADDTPELIQGDNDCDEDVDSVDGLAGLRHLAGLAVSQQPGCPALGGALPAAVPAGDPPDLFGDVDCDGDVDSVDQLKILRHVAALPFTQNEPCTDIDEVLDEL